MEEIEKDITNPDSESRRSFLEKAKRVLSECSEQYTFDDDGYDEAAEQAKIDEVLEKLQDPNYDIYSDLTEEEIEEMKRLEEESKDYTLDFFEESEEEQEYNSRCSKADIFLETGEDSEYENPQYLMVYNFCLKHSLAWYLMNRIDSEIILIDQQIERECGVLKMTEIPNGVDKFIELVRQSRTPFEGQKKIMEYFLLSEFQAEYLLEMKLRDVTATMGEDVLKRIEFYNFIKSLLRKLK